GQPVSLEAVHALAELGIDISRYRSQPVTEELVRRATFIFAMTRSHIDMLELLFPQAAEKTFLLREFEEGADRAEIPDPIGMGRQAYIECRDVIRKALPSLISFVRQSEEPSSMTPQASAARPLRIAIAADHG